MNVWPAILPQRSQRTGYSRALGDARLRSPMDAGNPKMRRRLSFIPQPIKAAIVMSTEQREIFERFADVTLKGGTLPFVFPAVDQDGTWIVQLGDTMPNWTEHSPGFWHVVLDLVKLGRGAFTIVADPFPALVDGEAMAAWRPRAANGEKPVTWSLSGNLPNGLVFDARTGEISGTPIGTSTLVYSFSVQAVDVAGKTAAIMPQSDGALFDFIAGTALIVDKKTPSNTGLRDIGDVLTNPGASATKLLRRKFGPIESSPWWANEYDAAGNPMGMRVEGQRTNLLTNSGYPNGLSGHTAGGAVAGSDFPGLPENTGVAFGPATATTGYVYKAFSPIGLTEYTLSVFVRMDDGAAPVVASGSSDIAGDFVLYAASKIIAKASCAVIDQGGGLYRITTTLTTNDAPGGSWGLIKYAGHSARSFKASGIQLEQAPFASSYISTGASAVTRTLDQPQIATGSLPFSAIAGTLIFDGMAYDYDTAALVHALGFHDTGGSSAYGARLMKYDTGARNSRLYGIVRDGGGYFSAATAAEYSFPTGQRGKVAMSWDTAARTGTLVSGVNGEIVEAADIAFNPTTLAFQHFRFYEGPGIMWHRSGIYIPRKLTSAELLQRVRA